MQTIHAVVLVTLLIVSCETTDKAKKITSQTTITSPTPTEKEGTNKHSGSSSDSSEILNEGKDLHQETTDKRFCSDNIFESYLIKHHLQTEKTKKNTRSYSKRSRARLKKQKELKAKYQANIQLNGPTVAYFGGLPVMATELVESWIRYYESPIGRKLFMKWLIRSKKYENIVVPLLKKEGLPKELLFMAMIESGFNDMAYSRARATGTWQFMKATAKSYNLKINHWIDERRDPVKSTLAAAQFLRDLYHEFGNWHLAMAAYNAGPGKINFAIKRVGSRDFWEIAQSRYIKNETKHYVPKMLAALIIATSPEKYGFWINEEAIYHTQTETVYLEYPTELKEIANRLGMPFKQLKKWNPELAQHITPPTTQQRGERIPYALRLPSHYVTKFNTIRDQLTHLEIRDVMIYKLKKGDTLGELARRHGIKIDQILSVNPKLKPRQLQIGRNIAIPVPAVIKKVKKDITTVSLSRLN